MFDLAALGGPGSLGYLGYCPCKWTDPAGPWGAFLNAAEREFYQDYIPRLQRKERDGKHRDKGGSERTSTETLPCSQHGHNTAGATSATLEGQSGFSSVEQWGSAIPHCPPFHLPFSDPSTPKSTLGCRAHTTEPQFSSRSQESTRHHLQLGLWLLFHCLPRTGPAPKSGAFQGEGAFTKSSRQPKLVQTSHPCKTNPTKVH